MKHLFFLAFLVLPQVGFSQVDLLNGCRGNDELTSITHREESINCTTYGYCRAYGYNPETGRYEYFYGYHSNCDGRQKRTITTYNCLNSQGIGYWVDSYGPWGRCEIKNF